MTYSAFGTSKPWTKQEDTFLRDFANEGLPWKEISGLLPGRTVSACQTRWNNHIKKTEGRRRQSILNSTPRVRDDRRTLGPAIAGDHYVFKVPNGDPLLKRLIAIHGNDRVQRDMTMM